MIRATNFLIITGSIAMIFVIGILIMIISLLWRIRAGVVKIQEMSSQLQSIGNIPFHVLERWLQSKEKPSP